MKDNGFLDLSDHDSFSSGVPHLTFKRIRNEDPIYWTNEKNGRGFWSITKHSDICLLYTSPSQRDRTRYLMPSSA